MKRFFSTCPAGMERLTEQVCQQVISGYTPVRLLPGALVYDAKTDKPDQPVFQNTYLLVAQYEGIRTPDAAAKRLLKDRAALAKMALAMKLYRFRTFRFMLSENNHLKSPDPALLGALEYAVRCGQADRVHPETEWLLLSRSEGFSLLLLRLSRRHTAKKGELSASVAHCMVALAARERGVFLDPFAGHGALGAARLALRNAQKILLSDTDAQMLIQLKRRFAHTSTVKIDQRNALQLTDALPPHSVDEIVTDPPWGCYAPLPEAPEIFYPHFLTQCETLLRASGRLVLLTADADNLQQAALTADMAMIEKHRVLINGKKAAIFCFAKE